MRTTSANRKRDQAGSILAHFVVVVILASALAALATYVTQTVNVAHRRNDMISAQQFADGAAAFVCKDLNNAITNTAGPFLKNLTNTYAKNLSLSSSKSNLFERTMTAPYVNQTVTAQIWTTNSSSPNTAKVVTSATVGKVTQSATVNVQVAWGYPAAIISTSPGTTSTSVAKSTAQAGNVVVTGNKSGPIIVDGGILANGQANIDSDATVPVNSISKTNYGTANQIPDYTAQGTANALFDFNRFIAVANATTNPLNTATHNNHFTNINTFIAANNAAFATPAKALEGVIVVEVGNKDSGTGNLNPTKIPNGINVKGTLFFNFGSNYGPLDKVINTATMNVNPANLSGLVATNAATYPTGYPPVYYDNSKNPANIDISASGYANFVADEDLPAVMYSIGTFDIHGNANICGVCYTPSYMEIENKADNQIQYFKGSLIMGLGIYYENNNVSKSIISFDPNALDLLATLGYAGKRLSVTYWE